ncbi:MAG: 50S ribosomal protein L10, partial [Clostridia bacterium]
VIEDIKAKIEKCASMVVIDYRGLTVELDTALRKEFRENGIEYKVVKNTMVRIALNELGYTEFDELLQGPTAIAFGYSDSILPIKVANDAITRLNKMSIKCGLVDKSFCNETTMKALSKVPSKITLLSMLCNVLQAPIRNLAVVIDQAAQKASAPVEA